MTHSLVRINNCNVMQPLQCLFLIAALAIQLAGQKVGYIHCSSRDNPLPIVVYSSPPLSLPLATLNCGDKVQVLGRRQFWVRISSNDGEHYVPIGTLSQWKDRFVAVYPAPLPEPETPADQRTGPVPPRLIYSTNPEYTQAAQNEGIHGFVHIKLTIRADGTIHDVSVMHGLGFGLDESAVKAVQSWKFEPALQNGVPVDCAVVVELEFPPKSN